MSLIKLESNASGSGVFTIASPNSNTNRTLTLPDATGTIITTAGGAAISGTTGTFTGLVDISAAGAGQIKFPATQNASSDANTLDDYEEGEWTPTLTAASSNPTVSYTRQQGKYVKVGQLVYVSLNILTSSVSGGSGMLRVSGLPFTSSTGTEADRASAVIGYVSGFSATTTPTVGLLISNGTYMDLYTTGSSDARENKITSVNSPPASNINLYMTLVYRAGS